MTDATKLNSSVSHISMLHRPFGPRVHMDENAAGGSPGGGGDGGATSGGGSEAPARAPATFSGVADAARFLAAKRNRAAEGSAGSDDAAGTNPTAGADPSDAGNELSDEGNAAPAVEPATGETRETAPAQQPPRELPRSWTKEQAASWTKLDPATQDFLLEQDRKASAEIRRVQNEAADARKAADAERAKWEQSSKQQATLSPAKLELHSLLEEQRRDFPDIQSEADLVKLNADPLRAIAWNLQQQRLAAAQQRVTAAEKADADQKAEEWKTFRSAQDAEALKHIPELGDAQKGPELMRKAVEHLTGLGFTAEELGKYDAGEKLSLFDNRVQRLIFDAMRYQDMQKAAKAAVAKPVPPVARPGSKPAGNAGVERVQALANQFNNSGNLRDAAKLLAARRAANRR